MEMTRREFTTAFTGVVGAATLGRTVTPDLSWDPCHLPPPSRR